MFVSGMNLVVFLHMSIQHTVRSHIVKSSQKWGVCVRNMRHTFLLRDMPHFLKLVCPTVYFPNVTSIQHRKVLMSAYLRQLLLNTVCKLKYMKPESMQNRCLQAFNIENQVMRLGQLGIFWIIVAALSNSPIRQRILTMQAWCSGIGMMP